jgi:hypothetical protein
VVFLNPVADLELWFTASIYCEEDNICLAIDIMTIFYLTAVVGHYPLA